MNETELGDEIVKLAATGDRKAQETIYRTLRERLFGVVRRMVGPVNAEDVFHDCFLRLFSKLHEFRFESAFSTWAYRIAVNEALQALRRQNRSSNVSLTRDPADDSHPSGAQKLETAELIDASMSKIDPDLRTILYLREVDQLSYAEIANVMGIAEGTVASRLNRARTALRNHLCRLGAEF